jgi:hypothetical protein
MRETRMTAWVRAFLVCASIVLMVTLPGCTLLKHIPAALETIPAENGSSWERVSESGFGDEENFAVVAMEVYKGRLYAIVRNDIEGVEVWRTSGTGWEQVPFRGGFSNGIYGNRWVNSHMGSMIVLRGKLYFGFSSGIQGNYLKSSGGEIWRFDGQTWEPVISDKKDTEESGTITGISGCDADDGDVTAEITDSSKRWSRDEWAGGVLQITSGDGQFRRFDIISNTEDTLTVQQNEIAGEVGTEYTICESAHYENPFPPHEYDLGTVDVGEGYEIGTGSDENGFGDYFNKTIPTMAVFNNKLYAGTALNYDYGGQVWYTEDGDTWTVTEPPRSMGLFHTEEGYVDSKKPVTRGIPSTCACDCSGAEVLYAGTLGSPGNLGGCARMARLTDSGWELIVDASVDDDDTGTNESGFGDGIECDMLSGNFNVWSLTCFKGKLFAGVQSLGGLRVLYTPNGSSEDGSWYYSVGGDSGIPHGFDDVVKGWFHVNIAVVLFPFEGHLYAGVITSADQGPTPSQLWRTSDGTAWEQVTDSGFRDDLVISFDAFAEFDGDLYVAGNKAANTVGEGFGGAKIYRLAR